MKDKKIINKSYDVSDILDYNDNTKHKMLQAHCIVENKVYGSLQDFKV